jgi:hypothetical protein
LTNGQVGIDASSGWHLIEKPSNHGYFAAKMPESAR